MSSRCEHSKEKVVTECESLDDSFFGLVFNRSWIPAWFLRAVSYSVPTFFLFRYSTRLPAGQAGMTQIKRISTDFSASKK